MRTAALITAMLIAFILAYTLAEICQPVLVAH